MFNNLGWILTLILLLAGNPENFKLKKVEPVDHLQETIIMDNTVMLSSDGAETTIGTWFNYLDGKALGSFQVAGNRTLRWRQDRIRLSGKLINRMIRSINGNISGCNLKIIHWNGGGRKWENKLLELECLVEEYRPDLYYISEANLWVGLEDVDMDIQGYTLHLPNTMKSLGHARLALLVKNDINVEIISEKNDTEAAMVWVKIGHGRKNSLLVGGVYRQHQLLGRSDENVTSAQLQQEQERRWSKIVSHWRKISLNMKCVLVGDLNLDYLKWSSPEIHQERMVDNVKNWIETSGFLQLVTGYTRTWRMQADSLLDQVWSNNSERILKVYNDPRGASDHNVVGVMVSLKEVKSGGQNVVKRLWKDFNEKQCMKMFKETNWQDIMVEDNVNIANSLLEDKIRKILDILCSNEDSSGQNWISVLDFQ